MTNYEVTVTKFSEQPDDPFSGRPGSTLGIIEIKPPISVGAKLSSVVLGQEHHEVGIDESISTSEATFLIASARHGNSNQEARQDTIKQIAARLTEFLSDPNIALEMMQQNPFRKYY